MSGYSEVTVNERQLIEAIKRMEAANLTYQEAKREYNAAAKYLNDCAQGVSSFIAVDSQRKTTER